MRFRDEQVISVDLVRVQIRYENFILPGQYVSVGLYTPSGRVPWQATVSCRRILAGNVNVIIVRSAEAKDLITRSSRFRDSMMRVHRGVSACDASSVLQVRARGLAGMRGDDERGTRLKRTAARRTQGAAS